MKTVEDILKQIPLFLILIVVKFLGDAKEGLSTAEGGVQNVLLWKKCNLQLVTVGLNLKLFPQYLYSIFYFAAFAFWQRGKPDCNRL